MVQEYLVDNKLDQSWLQVPSNGFTETSFSKLDWNKIVDIASLTELRSYGTTPFDDDKGSLVHQLGQIQSFQKYEDSHQVPIGWARISDLVQTIQVDAGWVSQMLDSMDDEEDLTIADLAALYWQHLAGPIRWCQEHSTNCFTRVSFARLKGIQIIDDTEKVEGEA